MSRVFQSASIERNGLRSAIASAALLGCMLAACASSDPAQDGEQEVDGESAEALTSSPHSLRYICANKGGGPFISRKAAIAHCGIASFVIVKTLKECRESVCGDCRTDREACLRCGRCEADR